PKIVTITFSVFLSRFTSSTVPLKLVNGPSLIRTCSPRSNTYFGFGFSAAERTCVRIRSTSAFLGRGRVRGRDLLDLVLAERRRLRARPDEPGDLRRVLHDVPRVVGHVHLDQDVPREEPARALHFAPAALLDDVLGRDQDLADLALQAVRLDPLLERLLHLVLEPRIGVD